MTNDEKWNWWLFWGVIIVFPVLTYLLKLLAKRLDFPMGSDRRKVFVIAIGIGYLCIGILLRPFGPPASWLVLGIAIFYWLNQSRL